MSANPEQFVATPELDIEAIRAEFPILEQRVNDKPLVFLDSAASAQKPRAVIDAVSECYSSYYANVHRGVHTLSERSTDAYEKAREKTRAFFNAASFEEIVFVRGTTEAINLVAQSYGGPRFQTGDEIILTTMEHHANIVPWQLVAESTGAVIKVIPIDDCGVLDMDAYRGLLNARTKMVAVAHVSNVLGTVNPVREIVELAHEKDIPVLVDGAQSAPHMPVDVRELDCDFYAFSAHKAYGPSGIGALYAKKHLLKSMPPYQGGGGMINRVTFERTTYADLPDKFEAGTPNIAGAIGMGAGLEWLAQKDMQQVHAWGQNLAEYAAEKLGTVPGLRIIGEAPGKVAVVSFVLEGAHPHDIATILDGEGVAVRAGHHCAQPLMDRFGLPATLRASFGIYNTHADVDALVAGLDKVRELFEL